MVKTAAAEAAVKQAGAAAGEAVGLSDKGSGKGMLVDGLMMKRQRQQWMRQGDGCAASLIIFWNNHTIAQFAVPALRQFLVLGHGS